MSSKQEGEKDEIWEPENPTDFRVYDVPTELKNDYISMAPPPDDSVGSNSIVLPKPSSPVTLFVATLV